MTVPSLYRLQRNRHDSTVPFTQKYDNGHDYMVSLTEKHLDDRHDCTVAALREEQNKMAAR